jgi:cation diffusion facilitator family transporter
VNDRYGRVATVLWRVMFLNLAVALAKIGLGHYSGTVSIISEGYHSLTDTAGNVVGLIGVSIARRPPDANHPYGHRKYETMASVGIMVFLIVVLVQVLSRATDRFLHGGAPHVFPEGIALMAITLVINILVVSYESREGRRLKSEVLLADARHTRSDVLTSTAVLGALVGVWFGYPILDPMAALLVAIFIGHACWRIAQEASPILGDEMMMDVREVQQVVQGVPGVLGSEKIRARGSADYVFLDLHLWLDPQTPLFEAHQTSHVVKDKLMAKFPQLMDVVIHIEPPPSAAADNSQRPIGQR